CAPKPAKVVVCPIREAPLFRPDEVGGVICHAGRSPALTQPWPYRSIALCTGRLILITLLPVNHILLLVREVDLLALLTGQFCPAHIRIREVARLKTGAAKVGISQIRPHEIDFAENRSPKITSRKVGVSEVDSVEVIPTKS